MKFNPEKLSIADKRQTPFIDPDEIWNLINNTKATKERIREIIAKSLDKQRLTLEETAALINADSPELIEEIKEGARELKKRVYGNRIVLFAPLYVGNKCSNNCSYCGFRTSNKDEIRKTLNDSDLVSEVEALEDTGQKRLILVYGEHKEYSPEFIAHTVDLIYGVKKGQGEIRRVNINAAPLTIDGFRTVKASNIGTYQIFQETYNKEAYSWYHLGGKKADFDWRLTSLDRAQEAGIDDVGIGALFGLYDWRFEVMGLVRHTNHLEACYNVGPHTISFPRIQDFSKTDTKQANVKAQKLTTTNEQRTTDYHVSDEDFVKLVAILRLAVPYTGMILTAREPAEIRTEVMKFGVSQIDGGTKLEIGGYSDKDKDEQNLNKEQFKINDSRPLHEIIDELLSNGFIPSFCTACYRLGRTGEHFMEFSVPGFIKRYCTPNAILTLTEYLVDYAPSETAVKGWALIDKELEKIDNPKLKEDINNRIDKIKQGTRDLYF